MLHDQAHLRGGPDRLDVEPLLRQETFEKRGQLAVVVDDQDAVSHEVPSSFVEMVAPGCEAG